LGAIRAENLHMLVFFDTITEIPAAAARRADRRMVIYLPHLRLIVDVGYPL